MENLCEGEPTYQFKELKKLILEREENNIQHFSMQKESGFSKLILKINELEIEFIPVTGSLFNMGNKEGDDDEKPLHMVRVKDFYIGKTEVTQELYRTIMKKNPSEFNCDFCPVERVSWLDTQEFIKKLNQITGLKFRLPSEAEWEFSAKGGKKSKRFDYSGGNEINKIAWNASNSSGRSHPVSEKEPNELGISDMTGNVWEWCQDWYEPDYYQFSPKNNPVNTNLGSSRVLRGCSWRNNEDKCRVTYRFGYSPTDRRSNVGFRLVLDYPLIK
uniref:formylglycine-generating enzyme family protein n=1 Tax=Ornithobacterium rhinotracheale TaxID=28251 RepID=UPI0039A4F2DD